MQESEFLQLTEKTLTKLEDVLTTALDNANLDYDIARQDILIELTLPDRSKMIINGQLAMQQIWVACRLGAFHCVWHDGQWHDTKTKQTVFALLESMLKQILGVDIELDE